jgi:hypothetical protein
MKKISPALREYRRAIDALAATWKDPHYDRCGRCKAVGFMALLEGDTAELRLAARLVEDHARSGALCETVRCDLAGCVFHEELPIPVARRIARIHKSGWDGPDGRGRKTATAELGEDGTLFVRASRRKASAHVWVEPPGDGSLEDVARGWDLHFPACRGRCLERYREIKELALLDLEVEPATRRERRGPFAAPRGGRR